jgi:quinol monooxygenase YgiN
LTSPVKIVAVLAAKQGFESELEALLRGMIAPSRAEPGNLRYDLWQDIDGPHRFVLDELYRDEAAVASHRASSHFQSYLSRINDLADRTAALVQAVDVADVGRA